MARQLIVYCPRQIANAIWLPKQFTGSHLLHRPHIIRRGESAADNAALGGVNLQNVPPCFEAIPSRSHYDVENDKRKGLCSEHLNGLPSSACNMRFVVKSAKNVAGQVSLKFLIVYHKNPLTVSLLDMQRYLVLLFLCLLAGCG